MPALKPARYIDLEVELTAELKRGGIVEAPLASNGAHVHGICEGQSIVINPAPAVVDTLLHELLHRRYPRWGEARVRKTAERLVFYMDATEVRRWYKRYQKAKRTRQATVRLED
jgi:hypothetical protein